MSSYEKGETEHATSEADEGSVGHDRFVMLFANERKRIFGFIYSLLPVPADAEDVFQQVSLVLWQKFSDFDETKSFYNWACGIAFNHVRNYRRSAYRKRICFSDKLVEQLAEDSTALFYQEPEREEFLRECLALLKKRDRDLLSDIYRDGKSAIELAEVSDKNVSTIYNRLSRVRKQLYDCINRKMAFRRQHAQ